MLHKSDYVETGVPLINPTNIADDAIVPDPEKRIRGEALKRLSNYALKPGDVLVGRRGEIGRCAVVGSEEEGWICGTGCFFVRPLPGLNSHFLAQLLRSPIYRTCLERASTGATMKNMSNHTLAQMEISVPPPPEQQRIVAILDEAFEGITTAKANAERSIQNARAIFERHLQSVFAERGKGWTASGKPLEDLCELIVDCKHKTAPTQKEGIPSIRTPNIGKGRLLLDDVNRVSMETYKAWTRRAEPMAGDLILAREAPAGNVAIVPENTPVCLGQRTVLIRPRADFFLSEFLALLLLEPSTQAILLAHSRGATVQHVNMKDIRALNVGAIPSISEQRHIVAKLDGLSGETQRLVSIYERKLEALDALKKSILDRAFSGELTAKRTKDRVEAAA